MCSQLYLCFSIVLFNFENHILIPLNHKELVYVFICANKIYLFSLFLHLLITTSNKNSKQY